MKQVSNSSVSTDPLVARTHLSLQKAVTNALERKRKLGHYSVTGDHKQIIIQGEDAPRR